MELDDFFDDESDIPVIMDLRYDKGCTFYDFYSTEEWINSLDYEEYAEYVD